MTDSPTKTAEQIVATAMSGGNRAYSTHDIQVGAVVAALREAGLLVSGAPSEEQWNFGSACPWCDPDNRGSDYTEQKHEQKHESYGDWPVIATEAKSSQNFVSTAQVDETKLAEVISEAFTERRPGEGIAAGAARRAVERQDEWLRGGAR
ncbi:hypothetical protein QBL02_13130 [Leucobacter sp. UT-8R-CII-1-4]|uniref:hypothetical protein n=1 Tax=Leucobacter sp. UT-8R-CII-1-4 TaxID=3040075 RepID=UPI0024A95CA9|nr:hypothetical protein [Leucobacter sp. UT-8R-CII-1-4]MDI6024484.1 hypothetical protein [Leucobacter sp. UT-8R-CII-1-4]